MLTLPTMGLLALGSLWLHTLLVTLAGLRAARGLARRLGDAWAHTREATLAAGMVQLRATRLGRPRDDGALQVVGQVVETRVRGVYLGIGEAALAVPEGAELWAARPVPRPPPPAGPDLGARPRTWVDEWTLRAGAPLFVVADLGPEGLRARPGQGGRVLLSTEDPRRVLGGRLLLLLGGHLAGVGLVAGVSALALHAPFVSPLSTVGALAALGVFLGILPLGTALRDATRLPGVGPDLHTLRTA